MLEIMAGYDGMDGRQNRLQLHKYTDSLGEDIKGYVDASFNRADPFCR